MTVFMSTHVVFYIVYILYEFFTMKNSRTNPAIDSKHYIELVPAAYEAGIITQINQSTKLIKKVVY